MKKVKLGEIADFINGFAFKPNDWGDQGLKIIRIQNLTDPTKPYNFTKRDVPDKYLIKNGDILVSWSATIDIFEWQEEDALLNQHIFKVIPNYDILDKTYFKYALKQEIYQMSRYTHGSTMKHINRQEFLSTKIPLPSLSEQKRIANILDKADEIRQKRRESLKLCDEYLRSVFLDMFGDPVTNPKGWEVKTLGSITHLITDGKHGNCIDDENSGFYFISAKDIFDGEIHYSNARQILQSDFEEVHRRTNLMPGDIVVVNTGATIGKTAIVKNDPKTRKTTFQKSVAIIKPNLKLILPDYLNYVFVLRINALSINSYGSAVKNMLLSEMRRFKIPIPQLLHQSEFIDIIKKTEEVKAKMQAQLDEAENLFGSLMQRAFRGEL